MRIAYLQTAWLLMATACPAGEVPGSLTDPGTTEGSSMAPPDLPDTPTTSDTSSTSEPDPASTGTSEASTTTGTTDATTMDDVSLCGNGLVDPGEMCDLGLDNSDVGYCKNNCTRAVCGDGVLWIGVEQCDDPGGNDGMYGGCAADCKFSPFCGDGELHPSESCDAGPLNGTGEHAEGFVSCSATCGLEAKRIFITSKGYMGNLGGLSGADLKCQALALAAGWDESVMVRAWLSDATSSPLTRFEELEPFLPLALVNGRRVASSLADLVTHGPEVGISLDEQRVVWTDEYVWTNTAATGKPFSDVDHCAGWIAASPDLWARVGVNAVNEEYEAEWSENRWWTSQFTRPCNVQRRLYCLEL